MTVPADEPQTNQDAGSEQDGREAGLAVPAAGLAGGAGTGGGGGLGVPLVAGLMGADDEERTTDEAAQDAGEREVGGSDGPVGGTTPPR
ncbi:hypothetical protein CLV35_3760 [Motilibacter peucedani]|uniref:Uncharacterized protein n=1 Tax=Motilibacter peucedani TaxID=598650 RepID=A0A420XL41_9ACTN|nr:hypothetical protein [Motilibacter peucedani]RKS68628.1 hypothetical protein CLV35_3760 [Motilibacter peucedani]